LGQQLLPLDHYLDISMNHDTSLELKWHYTKKNEIYVNSVEVTLEVDKIVTRKGGLNCDPLKINL